MRYTVDYFYFRREKFYMDDLYFVGSFTAPVFFNQTPYADINPSVCSRQNEGVLKAILLFLILCLLMVVIRIRSMLAKEVKVIELAPNPDSDFLDRIGFAGEIPSELVCIITQCIMQDPVRIDGGHDTHVFERGALEIWMNENSVNPLNRKPLSSETKLIAADDVSKKIKIWMNDLRLRRYVFSIWSKGKVGGDECIVSQKSALQ